MSILIYACARDQEHTSDLLRQMAMLPQQLLPDNVVPRPMSLLEARGIVIGVLNPTTSVSVMGTSACIGSMPNTEDWHVASHGAS